jgi:hypothetical protein
MNLKTTIKTTIFCALLLNILVLSAPQLISEKIASADVGQAVFWPNNYQAGTDKDGELQLTHDTCMYIMYLLIGRGAYGCYYSPNSTLTSYCNILSTLNNYYEDNIVFSKGHRGYPYANTSHLSLLDHTGVNVTDYPHIYDRTSSENVVTFIWHCETAEYYDEGATPDGIGYYGMPYCWTHNSGMECYGDSGTQVFLGWVDGSPQFLEGINGTIYNYAHVAYYFWYYMCNGYSVVDALDNIAEDIFECDNYLASPLRDWLVIWGNRTLTLP